MENWKYLNAAKLYIIKNLFQDDTHITQSLRANNKLEKYSKFCFIFLSYIFFHFRFRFSHLLLPLSPSYTLTNTHHSIVYKAPFAKLAFKIELNIKCMSVSSPSRYFHAVQKLGSGIFSMPLLLPLLPFLACSLFLKKKNTHTHARTRTHRE